MLTPSRSRRKGLALLLLAFLLALAPAAAAQGGTRAESLTVSLWPEFDRPDVLVIYKLILPADQTLPTTVSLRVPADAPTLTAVAFRDESGQLLNADFERVDGAEVDTVVIQSPGREVQIEYYTALGRQGDERSFTYAWPGGVAAEAFWFEVQQPFGADSMEVTPAASTRTSDTRGLVYHNVAIGPIEADDRPEVSFGYRKTTPELSAEVGAPPALATPVVEIGGGLDFSGALPYLLLVGGIGLIAAGVAYFLRSRQVDRRQRPRHRSSSPRPGADREIDASPVFCHNCGAQATASDRFCRRCGTALRS